MLTILRIPAAPITHSSHDRSLRNRQAKRYRREGVPIDRSTLLDLFHRTAELLSPLVARLLALVAEREIVLADETTLRVQAKEKTRIAWLWSFIARDEFDKELG